MGRDERSQEQRGRLLLVNKHTWKEKTLLGVGGGAASRGSIKSRWTAERRRDEADLWINHPT